MNGEASKNAMKVRPRTEKMKNFFLINSPFPDVHAEGLREIETPAIKHRKHYATHGTSFLKK
jgi:hypothetical protein